MTEKTAITDTAIDEAIDERAGLLIQLSAAKSDLQTCKANLTVATELARKFERERAAIEREFLEMMKRCQHEIRMLNERVAYLEPRAAAWGYMTILLDKLAGGGYGKPMTDGRSLDAQLASRIADIETMIKVAQQPEKEPTK